MNPNRPLYLAGIDEYDESTGIFLISFVGKPAMEVEALALSQDAEYREAKFSLIEDKMQLVGPIAIPDKRIYRPDGTDDGRDILFTAESIASARNKFHFKTGNLQMSNHDHVAHALVNAHMIESWIIEHPTHDKAVALGYNLPVGTWMGKYQVRDPEYWQSKVKTGQVGGFSLEGRFRFNKTNLAAIEPENPDNETFWLEVAREFLTL